MVVVVTALALMIISSTLVVEEVDEVEGLDTRDDETPLKLEIYKVIVILIVLVQYKIILYIVIVERFLKKKLKLKIQ
jgi:hypothetical protein